MKRERIFVDMDGTVADFYKDAKCLEKMMEKGFFANLDALPFAEYVNELATYTPDVYILSACVDTPYCMNEKRDWIEENIPFINEDNILLCKVGTNKAEFVKMATGQAITKDDILYDDYTLNLEQWTNANGRAIKVLNGINNTTQNWKGEMVDGLK